MACPCPASVRPRCFEMKESEETSACAVNFRVGIRVCPRNSPEHQMGYGGMGMLLEIGSGGSFDENFVALDSSEVFYRHCSCFWGFLGVSFLSVFLMKSHGG